MNHEALAELVELVKNNDFFAGESLAHFNDFLDFYAGADMVFANLKDKFCLECLNPGDKRMSILITSEVIQVSARAISIESGSSTLNKDKITLLKDFFAKYGFDELSKELFE